MNGYRHSELFARLKGTKEVITTNLTSQQYLQALDTFVYNACFSVIDNTKFVDLFLAKVIAWQSANPKRKGSNVGKQALLDLIVSFMLIDPESEADTKLKYKATMRKVKVLRAMKLDRNIVTEMLRQWLTITEQYETLCARVDLTDDERLVLKDIEVKAGLRPGHSLYGASTQTRYWYDKAVEFKVLIFQKYMRMVLNEAQRDYVQFGFRVELDDIVQQYMMTASKAIDKCDTDQGVLTSHIKNWLKSAKNIASAATNGSTSFFPNQYKSDEQRKQEQQQAQSMTAAVVPLESLENMPAEDLDEAMEIEDRIDRVRFIARVFDPQGYGRMTLGISEYLTNQERYRLRSYIADDQPRSRTSPKIQAVNRVAETA